MMCLGQTDGQVFYVSTMSFANSSFPVVVLARYFGYGALFCLLSASHQVEVG